MKRSLLPTRTLSPISAFVMVLALAIPLASIPAHPAYAAHFIAVEPRVDIIYDDLGGTFDGYSVSYATNVRLRLDHRWTSSGTFTLTLKGPDGSTLSTTDVPRTVVLNSSGAGAGGLGLQIVNYDFGATSLSPGVYTISGGSCCDKAFVNGTSSGSFSFDVGFYFDKDDRAASQGSPRFNSALITNIASGTTFSQDLGGQSVSPGGTVTLSLVENASTDNGAPVTVAGLKPNGTFQGGTAVNWLDGGLTFTGGDLLTLSGQTLTIPAAVSTAIAAFSTKSLKVKLRLEESVGGQSRGFLTRTIGFDFAVSTNNPPAISLSDGSTNVAAGGIVSIGQGETLTLTATSTDADAGDALTVAFTSLPSWASSGTQSGTNPATRTLTLSPTSTNSTAGDRTLEVTAKDNNSFSLTTSFSFVVRITSTPTPTPNPSPPRAAPEPVADPGGGIPAMPPGVAAGSVAGTPTAPTPSRPSAGAAEFRVGTVETRVDVASSGAGRVGGTGSAPVIEAVRDRVATVSGGGMRPGGIAEVWLPLPNGGSRQVALLPIGPDGRFDGALPFTGELDGRGPLPIGERTIQLFGVDANGQLTVINFGVRIEQPAPLAPEPDRGRGVLPALTPGQSLATNAGVPTPVTVTPIPDARTTRVEGDGWLMDVDVPDGEVRDEGGAPLIEIENGTDSVVRGTGFMPGTRAYVWLMSDPTFLGEVTVRADGSFSGSVPIDGVTAGEHTLQLSGVGTDGFVRAANLGVVLVGDGMPRPARVPAGDGPLQVPGGALLWVLGLAGTAAIAHRRLVVEGR
jgi:hypothetical protein